VPSLHREDAEPIDVGEVFIGSRPATDAAYARKLGIQDAARLRQVGGLTKEDKDDVNAKLKYFTGAAHYTYLEAVRPALMEVGGPGARPLSPGVLKWLKAGRGKMTDQLPIELNAIRS
jgi:hypothetical protein